MDLKIINMSGGIGDIMNNIYQLICESIKSDYKIVPYTKEHHKKYSKQFMFPMTPDDPKYPSRIIINTNNNDWIGYIAYKPMHKSIDALEVNRKYQRMGFGTILLNLFPKAVVLYARIYAKKARTFYEKNGWKDTGVRELYTKRHPPKFRLTIYSKIPIFKTKPSRISGDGLFVNIPMLYKWANMLAFVKIRNTGNLDNDYKRTSIGSLVNHSNKPNLKLIEIKNRYYFQTIKPVKYGEELTVDYKTFPWEGKRDFV